MQATGKKDRESVFSALMNSAASVQVSHDANNTLTQSPIRQGSGLIQVKKIKRKERCKKLITREMIIGI